MNQPQRKAAAWSDRSRSARKRASIRMKNEIARHAPHFGGLFTTHDVVDGSSWADVYFLSRLVRNRIYNGTVDTAIYAYFEKCESIAWDASESLLPFEELRASEMFVLNPDGTSSLADAKPSTVEAEKRAFGGLTRYEWIDAEKLRLADSGDVWVSPQVRLDRSYRFGIGLLATVAAESLTVARLDDFVAEFLAGGEAEMLSSSLRMSFPSSRAREASSVIAISDNPSEWAASAADRALSRAEREQLGAEVALPEATRSAKSL